LKRTSFLRPPTSVKVPTLFSTLDCVAVFRSSAPITDSLPIPMLSAGDGGAA
jgi:hypothetical protein